MIVSELLRFRFSPRAWRCFSGQSKVPICCEVFSTCVEVFLSLKSLPRRPSCFLHVRGGVSSRLLLGLRLFVFSPRAWRCFQASRQYWRSRDVFSTCVEVFLLDAGQGHHPPRFLHVRGGVSKALEWSVRLSLFSPRAWRCFLLYTKIRDAGGVFSTCVEVFLSPGAWY